MGVFKSVVYPYGVLVTDVDMYLSVRGKWSYDNKGRAFANFMIGTANYNDFIGTHNVKVSLKAGDKEIDSFTLTVTTKGEYSAGDNDLIAKELNDLQIKKIAVELANRLKTDRALIIDRVNHVTQSAVKQKTEPQAKGETQNDNTEKLNKLREGGVISEEEHRRAKDKIAPHQTDNAEITKKLQELDDLHKQGILSDEDYANAKKRLIGHTSKPGISLPEGWEKLTPTPIMLSGNVIYFAKNRTTDVVLVLSAEKREGITDLMELAIAKRAKLSNILSDPQPSEVSQIEIKGRKALRFNVAGELKNGQKITYLMTIIEGTTEIVLLNTSTNTANFKRQKEAMGQLAENITGL